MAYWSLQYLITVILFTNSLSEHMKTLNAKVKPFTDPQLKTKGLEFDQLSRADMLRIVRLFGDNVDEELSGTNGLLFDAHFYNNKYTNKFIYPQFHQRQ
ncbi:hypothetical protein JYU34_016931 [Plutella xylostella]|uniref:Uncharacterized protein n=1 Tax=Plutella xylostella TaxID=51655 RepID=A0ABQ7Q3V0_PLUXY|nr:hypothetical protein JYU34_016931 [Plutella xylostella]